MERTNYGRSAKENKLVRMPHTHTQNSFETSIKKQSQDLYQERITRPPSRKNHKTSIRKELQDLHQEKITGPLSSKSHKQMS